MAMRPNILWIVLDTARADALEPYGAVAGASPVVHDLARRGAAVEGVHSTASWTLPAHVSMFAGGLPRQLGLADQAGMSALNAKPLVTRLRERLIAEVLRKAGYRTAGVSTNAWVSETSGFATGFERFVDVADHRQAKMASESRRDRLARGREVLRARVDDGAAAAGRLLRDWSAELASEPFFWFVNLVECHSPYLPPKPHAELGPLGRLRAGEDARRYLTQGAVWEACVKLQPPPADALERMRAGYRGAIRYMDDWLGDVLEALDGAGRLDDTLVIVSSDHGENFGEGGLLAHGFSLDERLIRVPFIVAGPGAEALHGVRSVAELPALLAQIAGVARSPYAGDDLPPLPVAQFDSPAFELDHHLTQWTIDHWSLDEAAALRLTAPLTATSDGRHKLVIGPDGREGFYDL